MASRVEEVGELPIRLIRRGFGAILFPMALKYRLQSSPFIGKLTTKYLLPYGTRQVGDDVVFFNFGYEEDPPMALPLAASDEPNRFGIQLYHRFTLGKRQQGALR